MFGMTLPSKVHTSAPLSVRATLGAWSARRAGRRADWAVDLVKPPGGGGGGDYGDVGGGAAAAAMMQRAIDTWGRLDILVNNAGIVRDAAIWNMDPANFDAVMRVHVRGTWLAS